MSVWVLVAMMFIEGQFKFMMLGAYTAMDECFEAREYFMATGPQPKINYESICIKTDQLEIL